MLEIKNLSLFYGENNKVLDDISLTAQEGECILLTGESGSGKSSIINSINGLALAFENASSKGSIKVNNKEIKDLELYEISLVIASVFQNPKTHFFNVNTTLELLFYLENIGVSKEEMDARMEEMLKIFPIEHLLGRSIFELSGGEKQILCVASCYISGCKIIVLDEPSSNLDDKHIEVLTDMLKILKDKNVTLILAEHRIYYLMDLIDRVYLIQQGKINQTFSKEEFLSLSSKYLIKYGLRSRQKTPLTKSQRPTGKDFMIKTMKIDFEDKCELRLDNVSFNLGKIYGIVGRNGCGKSTFLRVMTGLNKKDKSEIVFKGQKLSKKERTKNSSLVMQDVNHQLFTESVEEELKLGVRDLSKEKTDRVLLGLGLNELKDRHPMSLSGGQKQRVAIASVLCKNSNFVYFDEPTSGMDYNNMLKIATLIKEMSNEENIIFIVSHDTEFLNEVADAVLNLEDFKAMDNTNNHYTNIQMK
ncbi:ABC transporter ATP-binding protein [Streptococcus merionis]|uniref:Cobalt transport ATP-binding protein cbiO n=1 Tax=Streptococcus merionis TaxID=400065 RepID=A0A239SSB0_9STRE|nr:ABC transporter ATP-binding protein [Streptococcus merionis]SNU88371.1 cobalt transport ATP-binding protein cbiO [Streptococcus merionis]